MWSNSDASRSTHALASMSPTMGRLVFRRARRVVHMATSVSDMIGLSSSSDAQVKKLSRSMKRMGDRTRTKALPFSPSRRDPRAPLQREFFYRTVEETCAFYGVLDMQGCREPRRAVACLRRPKCAVMHSQCQDAVNETQATDFGPDRLVDVELSALSSRVFMSDTTTICGVQDTSCLACGPGILRWEKRETNNTSVQCVGTSGCLCSELLSYMDRGESTFDSDCRRGSIAHGDEEAIRLASGGLALLLICLWTILWAMDSAKAAKVARAAARRVREQTTRVMRHMLDQVPGDLMLGLFGWRQHQRRLRYKEQQLLQGCENLSPVAQPLEYASSPSAPDFEIEEEASAPTKHDPMALASAPVFQSLQPFAEGGCWDDADSTIATAPEFDS